MKAIFSLVPLPWRIALVSGLVLLVGGSFGTGFWKGCKQGYATAEAIGNTAIASLQSRHDKAYAEAVEALNHKLLEETQKALEAGSKLAKAKVDHEKEKNSLQRRIAEVTAGSSCASGPAFVGMWNEAIGAACGGSLPAAGHPAGADGTPGSCRASGAWFVGKNAVSEADVLAHITYYGTRCKNLEAQVNAWIDLAEGWK